MRSTPKVILKVSSADGTTKTSELTEHDTFLLGRMEDCHLCVPGDPHVSRHHFLLEACPPMASLRDLGSLNGTHVNGKKCGGREKGETPEQGALRQYPSIDLKNGDRITVGKSTIDVRLTLKAKIMNHNPLVTKIQETLGEVTAIWLQPVAKLTARSAIDFLRQLVAETNVPKIALP